MATSPLPPTTPASVVETHISVVFFDAARAYKLLKPLRTGFLDHQDRAARLAAVDRELELNRRLAPDVYLGTSDIVIDGEVDDRMLVMRRLPSERRLSRRLASPGRADDLRTVAREVARFHSGLAPLRDEDASVARADMVAARWQSSFEEIGRSVPGVIPADEAAAVEDLVGRYLATTGDLFDRRIADGHVRDGHGDLTAEDIFMLADGPRIIDCLAFDDDLRIGDVLADIAFLVMDVERLAGPEAAAALMRYYVEFAGEHHPSSLAHFYVAYRAHVRAKVECLRHEQGVRAAAVAAARYHHLTLRHLDRARLRIVLVGGGPGAGKSTLARGLAERTGWALLDSDELRKDLAGVDHRERAIAPPGEGIYSPAMTDQVYATLAARAETLVRDGYSAILDASWTSEHHRETIRSMARGLGVEVVEICCEADQGLRRARVAGRLGRGCGPSDATPAIVDHLAEQADPWPGAVRVDTSTPPEVTITHTVTRVCGRSGPPFEATAVGAILES